MNAAASSWWTSTNLIRSWCRRRPSMIPLMPSPGSPKTVSTPQSADGTLSWRETTLVLVTLTAGDQEGIGWSYAAAAAAPVVTGVLGGVIRGRDAFDIPGAAEAMTRAVRNIGRPGIAATAISAVDVALHDLKARLLRSSVTPLLGHARD